MKPKAKPKQPLLIAIDANNILRRCFYAMDRLSHNGNSTHAVKGLLNKIQECQYKHKPTHITISFDGKGPNHRHKLYPLYKGNRKYGKGDKKKEAEELDFRAQVKLAQKLSW